MTFPQRYAAVFRSVGLRDTHLHALHPLPPRTPRCHLACRHLITDAAAAPNELSEENQSISDQVKEAQDKTSSELERKSAWLWFHSFPIRIGFLDPRVWISKTNQDSVLQSIKNAIRADDASDIDLKVEGLEARDKDGGTFVKVSYLPLPQLYNRSKGTSKEQEHNEEIVGEAIESWVRRQVQKSGTSYKPWFVRAPEKLYLVKGKPFMEDMDKWPYRVIRIEFEGGGPLSLEKLFEICRPYGRIRDIDIGSNFATVSYRDVRYAAAARNCLDGLETNNRTLHILYEKRNTTHTIRDWLSNHPRIVLPILAILLGGLSFLIFDPIRTFFIESKVLGRFDLSKYRAFAWLRKETLGRLGLDEAATTEGEITGIEKERQEAADQLNSWLKDWPDGFTVISGPRGSGKEALMQQITKTHENVLTIDCEVICKKGETDDKVAKELANQLGYFPMFGFLNQFNNMIDLASVGLIGTKAGFATSPEAQIKDILNVATNALISLSNNIKSAQERAASHADERRKTKGERQKIKHALEQDGLKDGRLDALAGNGIMSELGHGIERESGMDALVVAGPSSLRIAKNILMEGDQDEEAAQVSQGLPIVVLKSFATRDGRNKDSFWDALAEWGSKLIENKIAHVVVTSDNVLVAKPLAKALPSRPTNSIMLADASAENALDYVLAKLKEIGKEDVVANDQTELVAILGGRLSDLEILVQKLRSGSPLEEAVEDMVARSATEVKKKIYGDDNEEASSKDWTRAQAWYLTQLLADRGEVGFEDVLYNGPFKGNDKPLHALEQAGLVSVVHRDGEASLLRPGKPIWQAAFQRLVDDPVFAAIQNLAINNQSTEKAAADIKAAQEELILLGSLFPSGGKWLFTGSSYVPPEVAARVDALLAKIRGAQAKQAALAEEAKQLQAVLKY